MAGEGEEALAAFVALHGAALRASRVPTQYWESLSRKLRGEVGERRGAAPRGRAALREQPRRAAPGRGRAELREQPRVGRLEAVGVAVESRAEGSPWQPWAKKRVPVLLSRGQRERHGAGCVTETAARGCKRRQVYCAYLISFICCRREVWKRLESLVTSDTVLERGDESKKPQHSTSFKEKNYLCPRQMQDNVLNPSAFYAKES